MDRMEIRSPSSYSTKKIARPVFIGSCHVGQSLIYEHNDLSCSTNLDGAVSTHHWGAQSNKLSSIEVMDETVEVKKILKWSILSNFCNSLSIHIT